MKPGKPLERRTPLRSHTPLKQGGELSRSTPLPRSPMPRTPVVRTEAEVRASRRPLVTLEERRARRLVKARVVDGLCEGCGRWPAADYSHRVRRGPGAWCPSNALALCSDLTTPAGVQGCHPWAHSNPDRARELGWLLRTTDDPLTTPAVLAWRGWFLLADDGGLTPYTEEAA